MIVAGLVLLAGCEPAPTLERISGPTMGSTYTVQYVRTPLGPSPDAVRVEVEAVLASVDKHFSTYRADSAVERFNRLPAGSCQAMPADVLDLLLIGDTLSKESDGAFDLTVEPLLDLWGFGPQSRREQVPDGTSLQAARTRVGHHHLRIDGDQLCKDAAVELDFNSIAAGHAVDLIAARLQALGIASYLAEATGELKAMGHKPDGSAWRIGLERPEGEGQVIDVDGFAVSTSGDYRNYFEDNGRRYSHVFDARTGRPVTHRLAAVTVLHESAVMADGYSTLLLILGPEQGWSFAVEHKLAAVFVIRADTGFVTRNTPAFKGH